MTEDISEKELAQVREKRRRRLKFVIIGCLILIPVLTYIETKVFSMGAVDFPVSGNVLVFILNNINALLLLLMVFLVLRNLAELVFERKRHILGARLRTKLVISFVSLSLIPTGLLFFISLQFVSTSMDYWFNINVEKSLEESLDIAKTLYQDTRSQVRHHGAMVEARLAEILAQSSEGEKTRLDPYLKKILGEFKLDGIQIITEQRLPLAEYFVPELRSEKIPAVPHDLLRRTLDGNEREVVTIQPVGTGELVMGLQAFRFSHAQDGPRGSEEPERYVLVTSLLIPRERLEKMNIVTSGVEGYRQLKLLKKPIKTSLLVMLLIVTLLIIFCAVWFAFYVSRSLTVPIGKLAEATHRVAEGELDFVLEKESGDEMGTLVDSFNRMTRDLLASKKELEETNETLRERNQELNQRRRYTEIILQNITAGVISLDNSGNITTINRYAEELLRLRKNDVLHRSYRSILRPRHQTMLEKYLQELDGSSKSSIQRPVRITLRDETLSLRVNFVRLEDENMDQLGIVIVFDDLTELEKAQRMAAWREVARRIAHEVKNPLTPIQLSAQRLRKRYLDNLGQEGEIFDLCTTTIINQVEELKRLVGEFSNFARMPSIRRSSNNLVEIAREVLVLYREAHKQISFALIENRPIPSFLLDGEQMKRVLVNLLDNAVAAVGDSGVIEVELSLDDGKKLAFLEVRDDGPGVPDHDKRYLFEPYFSTKKTGTGLGLAIVASVVADHGGYIRVRDRLPRGVRFIIELPLDTG